MMKRVMVNGDDYGLNERCSRAIAQALDDGLITDTTMIANGDYFDGAVRLAREQGFSDRIGVHFNLTEGEPLTEDIRSIPDFVAGGRFRKDYLRAPRPLSEAEREAVYAELTAQIERIMQAGIGVTHADAHHYIHNCPALAPIVVQVCRAHGVDRVRLQRNIGGAAGFEENNRFWRGQGFLTTTYFGRMSDLEGEIPDRVEIMVHPDFDRHGRLIDRSGFEDGCAVGGPLRDLRKEPGVILLNCRDLTQP